MTFSQCGKIRLGEAATTVVTVLLGYLVVVDKVVNCSNKLNMTPVPHSSPWLLKSPTPSLRPLDLSGSSIFLSAADNPSAAPLRPVMYPAAKVLADTCPSLVQHHLTLPRRFRHH
jgi:hypothetical protein